MVAASEKLLGEGVKNFGMLFFVVGERNSAGALIAARAARGSKYLVNGEPTESKMALASKGILRYELVARGKMAHSAYPELGDSAIEKLLDALGAIRKIQLPSDAQLGPTTMNIGTISGGRAPNVIPDAAKAEIMIRLVGDPQPVRDAFARAVGERAEIGRGPDHSADSLFDRGRPADFGGVVRNGCAVFGTTWGQPLLFGPGSILVAHTTEERISKELGAAAEVSYAEMVKKLLTKN